MKSGTSALFQGEDWEARRLGQADLPAIEETLSAGRDYLEMVSGEASIPEEARTFLSELPPGKDISDKLSVGIFSAAGQLISLLDAIRDYPQPGTWWIGLLLLRSELRRQGLGMQILESFAAYAQRSGASELQLGVVEQNQAAYLFWQRVGFVEIERRLPRQAGLHAEIIIVMRKGLT